MIDPNAWVPLVGDVCIPRNINEARYKVRVDSIQNNQVTFTVYKNSRWTATYTSSTYLFAQRYVVEVRDNVVPITKARSYQR